jgi:hypothetical protein
MYVLECVLRTKDKLRTCNARTSTRLRKLWVSSRSWNSESLPTPSPPSPHVLARARRMSTVVFDSLTSYRPVAEAFLKDQITIGHALLIAKLPASQQQEAFSAAFRGLWTSEGNSQVLIPVRELAAWIESNILLQLASAPFDKQDETLVPEAGSCANCPKRTGFNKLLFPDVRKDSCTSPDCFRAKIDASVKKTLETKPQLIQISAAWNSREGAPLGTESVCGVGDQESRRQTAQAPSYQLTRSPAIR